MGPLFRIYCRINNFYVYAFYRNPGHYGLLYDFLLFSMNLFKSFDDIAVFVFVGNADIH